MKNYFNHEENFTTDDLQQIASNAINLLRPDATAEEREFYNAIRQAKNLAEMTPEYFNEMEARRLFEHSTECIINNDDIIF